MKVLYLVTIPLSPAAVSTLPNTEEPVIPVAEGGCNDRCVVGIVAGVIIAIPVLIVVIIVVVVILVLKYQSK